MTAAKRNTIFLGIMAAISLIWAGGYFVYVSSLLLILMVIYLIFLCIKEKKITLGMDWNMTALLLLVVFYLLSTLWATNSGMAVRGFIKYLPALLFYLILRQSDCRERLIGWLPAAGCVMTVVSFVMMRFEVLLPYVSVAGRLAGFFQYSNTYAVFMLICLIVVTKQINDDKINWLRIVYLVAALAGIVLSGSRTVFVLTVLAMPALIIMHKKPRRVLIPMVLAGVVAVVIALAAGGKDSLLLRFTNISFGSSTFLGRLLYYKDALPVILKHPFGLGYYGYYSVLQEIQTGYYSVVNVHNGLLQFMLDVGWIPALVFYGAIIKSLISKKTPHGYRPVLCVLILHSLFDFDFRFISIIFVLLLFLEQGKGKQVNCIVAANTGVVVAGFFVAMTAFKVGGSEFCSNNGDYKTALKLHKKNTFAIEIAMQDTDDIDTLQIMAKRLIDINPHSSFANSVLAQVALSNGDVGSYISYKEEAIRLAPYQYEEYIEYMDKLYLIFETYMKQNDTASAEICVERMENVFDTLEKVKEKTSDIAWKIRDVPQLTLPYEYEENLDRAKATLAEAN